MVGNQKVLLPPHEYVFLLRNVPNHHRTFARGAVEGPEGVELGPVVEVYLVVGPPAFVVRDEVIPGPDYFAFKVRGQSGVVFGQACQVLAFGRKHLEGSIWKEAFGRKHLGGSIWEETDWGKEARQRKIPTTHSP
jgi:hypothetical protein